VLLSGTKMVLHVLHSLDTLSYNRIKVLVLPLLIKTLCLFKPKPTLLDPLITFVNNFQTQF
jgi:hypothetical protein